jgi:glycine/D-amino acid oxidase-like deaminating enzyme
MHKEACFMGFFEANPVFLEPDKDLVFGLYDVDLDAATPYLEATIKVFPALKNAGQRSIICGPESFTPDKNPLFGETEV